MVCRNAKTNQAYPVGPLIISTEEEKTLFSIGHGAYLDTPAGTEVLKTFYFL